MSEEKPKEPRKHHADGEVVSAAGPFSQPQVETRRKLWEYLTRRSC
jgi:hypothetical protein